MIKAYRARMTSKAAALLVSIEGGLDRIMQFWLVIAGLATITRIATGPYRGDIGVDGLLPYVLLILAPFASMVLALRWFADGERQPQPTVRLARYGKWIDIRPDHSIVELPADLSGDTWDALRSTRISGKLIELRKADAGDSAGSRDGGKYEKKPRHKH